MTAVATAAGGGGTKADAGFKVPKVPMAQSVGAGEGKLNIIAWAGYAEDGSTDPKVDWVTPFEKQTGCQVNVKIGNTSDEMVTLMRTGQYDGVSASGDATLRLIAGGDVAPVNTNLVPNYADVFPQLKNQDFNSVNGQMYGIPHGRGANLLMWRSDKVTTPLDSWSAVFDQGSQYKGSLTAYDNPIYIADAALYLKATKPDLKITNPYELDDKQFQASVDLLKAAARRTSASTGRTTPRSRRPSPAATRPSAPPGRSSPTCSTPTRSRSRPRCPRRARPAGRTRG